MKKKVVCEQQKMATMALAAAPMAASCNKNGKLFKYIIDFMPFVYCKSLDFVCLLRCEISVSLGVFLAFLSGECWALGITSLPKPINNATTTMLRLTLFFFRPVASFVSAIQWSGGTAPAQFLAKIAASGLISFLLAEKRTEIDTSLWSIRWKFSHQ